MLAIGSLLLVLAGGAALAVWLTRALQGFKADSDATLAARNAEVGRQLEGITATMDRRLGELDTKVDRRMEHASKQTNAIHKQLGDVGRATTLLAEHAKELGQLQQVLRPPKARGGFGELLLGNLLRDRLPPEAYSLQYGFKSGERVDAVIRVDRLAPIDAKFPLDNFERLVDAQESSERELHEKAFARDVKGHVDAISSKYIRPDEGTYDFAFMYLPSEAIYYELTLGESTPDEIDILAYCSEHGVIPASPNTLLAYLQVVALGVRGLAMQERTRDLQQGIAQVRREFERFVVLHDQLGHHLENATKKFDETDRALSRASSAIETLAQAPIAAGSEQVALPLRMEPRRETEER